MDANTAWRKGMVIFIVAGVLFSAAIVIAILDRTA